MAKLANNVYDQKILAKLHIEQTQTTGHSLTRVVSLWLCKFVAG